MSHKLTIKDNKVYVVPNEEDITPSEIGVAYFIRDAHKSESEEIQEYMYYKLHSIDDKWWWIGMWNSIVVLYEDPSKTLELALKKAIKDGYTIEEE